MQAEFLVRYCDLKLTFERRVFPTAEILEDSGVVPEQRVQVAAQMDDEDWSAVAEAETRIRRTQRLLMRRSGAPFNNPKRSASQRRTIKAEIATLAEHRDAYKRAFRALASDVAKAFPDVDAEPPCPRVEEHPAG